MVAGMVVEHVFQLWDGRLRGGLFLMEWEACNLLFLLFGHYGIAVGFVALN